MKWVVRTCVAALVLVLCGAGVVYKSALRASKPVGFQMARALATGDRPVAVGI